MISFGDDDDDDNDYDDDGDEVDDDDGDEIFLGKNGEAGNLISCSVCLSSNCLITKFWAIIDP